LIEPLSQPDLPNQRATNGVMVAIEDAIAFIDALIFKQTGEHLDDLQSTILRQSWYGNRYIEIADIYGCTEGHAKDMGAQLWHLLSTVLGEKINKRNLQTALNRHLSQAIALEHSPPNGQADLLPDQARSAALATVAPSLKHHSNNPHFIGRAGAIAYLDHLASLGTKVILIQAQGGVGKTTLARQYLSQKFEQVLEFAIAKETNHITSIESLIEERLQQLGLEPGREFGISLDRLKQKLTQVPIGILIDNLEPALDRHGKFISPHRSYVELLVMLATPGLKSLTLITSRDRLSESAVKLRRYLLPGLELPAWQYYFMAHLPSLLSFPAAIVADQLPQGDRVTKIGADAATVANLDLEARPTIDLDAQSHSAIAAMHRAYGGNAKAMDILASAIANDYDGDIVAYWQEFQADPLAPRDLANLVTSQFKRLQTLDPAAYRLLCRLGCYRYQDVATIPREGILALLWDTPATQPEQSRRLMESLRDRSLIEHRKGSYWLHPVIRAEAIARLREASNFSDYTLAGVRKDLNLNPAQEPANNLANDLAAEQLRHAVNDGQPASQNDESNSSEQLALEARTTTELVLANRAAAKFWAESTSTIDTVTDALRCFEAYYHYLAIADYEAAAAVILQRRQTKSTGIERLGRTFYKLGLLKQMITAIAMIINHIHSAYYLSGLYGIWGVLYRLSGQIQAAIDCHTQSAAIAKQHLDLIASPQTNSVQITNIQVASSRGANPTDANTDLVAAARRDRPQQPDQLDHLELLNLKNWQQHALLNIGICQIELWELEAAKQTFTQLNTANRHQLIAENLAELYNPSVDVFSAYVHSCLDDRTSALEFAQAFDRKLSQNPGLGTGHRLLFLGLTYKNLGQVAPAADMLNRAIAYANQHHYTQVKANAISGLAELYRCQQNYQMAMEHHQTAIALLAQIGTKCDLAEAYYQKGLTHQAQKDRQLSQASYNQSLQLFAQMQAPHQIQKVQQAIAKLFA
jgi:tetratricopeptide (TPR) repeat protein